MANAAERSANDPVRSARARRTPRSRDRRRQTMARANKQYGSTFEAMACCVLAISLAWGSADAQRVEVNASAPPATSQPTTAAPPPSVSTAQPQKVKEPPLPSFSTPRDVETGSALTSAEASAMVKYHNAARAEVRVPDVRWSK